MPEVSNYITILVYVPELVSHIVIDSSHVIHVPELVIK